MKHLYSYKYRLLPNKTQEILLNKHFGCTRFIYNHFLGKRKELYKEKKKSSNYNIDAAQLPILKKEYSWLKEVGSQALQYTLKCLQSSYDNFFHKRTGFPKFKRRHNKQSFKILQNINVCNNKLICPKFLEGIEFVEHKELEGNIRFATISKNKCNQYYVSITTEREILPLPKNTKCIGLDLNVKHIVDNEGNKILNPRPGNTHKARLKFLHQQVSRSIKKSKNRTKAKYKLSKLYLKIHNIREDFLHKLSKHIINENQVICVETLSVKDMLAKVNFEEREEPRYKEKNRHRDITDCAFFSFVQKLIYKALWYGRELVKIDKWFPSSQLCYNCKHRNKELQPNEREWLCYGCLEMNDRDTNAAKNILDEGIKTCGIQGLAYCPDVRLGCMSELLVG